MTGENRLVNEIAYSKWWKVKRRTGWSKVCLQRGRWWLSTSEMETRKVDEDRLHTKKKKKKKKKTF